MGHIEQQKQGEDPGKRKRNFYFSQYRFCTVRALGMLCGRPLGGGGTHTYIHTTACSGSLHITLCHGFTGTPPSGSLGQYGSGKVHATVHLSLRRFPTYPRHFLTILFPPSLSNLLHSIIIILLTTHHSHISYTFFHLSLILSPPTYIFHVFFTFALISIPYSPFTSFNFPLPMQISQHIDTSYIVLKEV